MATATKDSKKAKKDEAPAEDAPKQTSDPRPVRVSALVTITQTKTIDAQFGTTSKKVEELDKKLVEVEQRFIDAGKTDHQFAVAVREARAKLAEAATAIVEAQDGFGSIRATLEDFFG